MFLFFFLSTMAVVLLGWSLQCRRFYNKEVNHLILTENRTNIIVHYTNAKRYRLNSYLSMILGGTFAGISFLLINVNLV